MLNVFFAGFYVGILIGFMYAIVLGHYLKS